MKPFKQLREAKKVDPEIFGNKDKFLAAASKFNSTVDFGYTFASPGYTKWWNDTQGGLSPDGDWYHGDYSNFDTIAKECAKLKSFGLTHIFAFRDPNMKPGVYHSIWIETVRFSGKNDKIAQGLAQYWKKVHKAEESVWGSKEDITDDYGYGSAYGSLVLGSDKPDSSANQHIKKYGTVKLAPWKKIDWKKLDKVDVFENFDEQIAIIKV